MKTDRKNGYVVNGEKFKTKQLVTEAIRKILYAYRFGTPLTPEHQAFMVDLLQHHRDCDGKLGCGVWFITVEQNPKYPSQRGFWITRTDGSRIDFSFIECLRASGPKQWFRSACRSAVLDQIIEFKNATFAGVDNVMCPLTGDLLTPESCHVDHEPPDTFEALLMGFCALAGIDENDPALTRDADDGITVIINDRELETNWVEYHRVNARLRLLSRWGNLSLSKRAAP